MATILYWEVLKLIRNGGNGGNKMTVVMKKSPNKITAPKGEQMENVTTLVPPPGGA
jgi:hypothetical protein